MNTLKTLKAAYAALDAAQNQTEAQAAIDQIGQFYAQLTAEQKAKYAAEIAQIVHDRLGQSLETSRQERVQMAVEYAGSRYAYPEWVTIASYCKLNAINNIQTVFNWLKRGIISTQDTVEIPELNDLKLIRNKTYKTTVS